MRKFSVASSGWLPLYIFLLLINATTGLKALAPQPIFYLLQYYDLTTQCLVSFSYITLYCRDFTVGICTPLYE